MSLPPHVPANLPPFPTGQAARTLGSHKRQMDKLIDCGLVRVAVTTGGGQRRVDARDIFRLAARPAAGPPSPGDVALHLRPLARDDHPAHQRTPTGWHVAAAARGLTREQIEDAWAGLWKINPEPHIGAALVGNVAGFVVALGIVTGYRRIAGRIRFLIAPPTPTSPRGTAIADSPAHPGDVVQRLRPAAP